METVGYAAVGLLAVSIIVQAVVWALAEQSARHAAHEALQAARTHGSTAGVGQAEADAVLATINPSGIRDARVAVDRGTAITTVTITATAHRVVPLPGLSIPVRVRVHAPTEHVPPAT